MKKRRITLEDINRRLIAMSAQLDHLKASVASLQTVDQSATALLAGLSQQLRDAKDDPAAIDALANDIDTDQAALAAAVAANTPAAAPQPPQPAPTPPADTNPPADGSTPPADGSAPPAA